MDCRSSVPACNGRASRAIRFVWLGWCGWCGMACSVAEPPDQGADGPDGADRGIESLEDSGEGPAAGDTTESGTTEPLPEVRLDIGSATHVKIDADPDSMNCPDVSVAITPTIPTVLLMLDQSYSMTFDFGTNSNRWDAVYDTLFDPTSGVVYLLDSRVRFGMTLYSAYGIGPDRTDECPRLISQDPVFGEGEILDALYASEAPFGDTPTGESLDALIPDFAALESDGPKVIVLATDGEPDTCAEPMADMGQAESLAAAERAFAAGLPLFIISVGDDVGASHLQEMANLGVGKAVDDVDPAPYYQALSPAELVDAFLTIIGSVASCEFEIDGKVDTERACMGDVLVNGVPIECDRDWQVVGESTLTLLGEACENLKSGQPIEVTATWPCDIILPIG